MSEQAAESDAGCTCTFYVVDYSDPERYHPENLDREDDPGCPFHGPSDRAKHPGAQPPGPWNALDLARAIHRDKFPTHADCDPNRVEIKDAERFLRIHSTRPLPPAETDGAS